MASHPKYLVQEIEGQDPFVYDWTPVLAAKKDMRPISNKEAEKILNRKVVEGAVDKNPTNTRELSEQAKARELLMKEEKEARENASNDEFVGDDEEDNKILDTLKTDSTIIKTSDGEAKDLVVTQEDLLAIDSAKINRLRSKASIEEYMFKKYKVDMMAMETPADMKDQAISMLTALAGVGSLYDK